ncbi:DUF2490 domain-containing protein [Sphingomonas oligophenolica]|uniref:DUF2490 domain-containing protein n=1 Tax=Sphingomonas oligophenolica TaxID=301154 RepID=A0ABU9Y9A9_9SPHN
MNRYHLIAAGLFATAPASVAAQRVQPWPTIFVSAPVARGWSASGELVNRVSGDPARPSQLEARLQLGRHLSGSVTLWAGYVHVVTYHLGQPAGIENQSVEQLNWAMGSVLGVTISSRTRLEQRFQRGADATNWRLRAQLRLALPVARNGTSLVAWTEPFVALNHTSANRETFDQIRNFIGVSVPVAKHVEVEVGYLNQYLHRPSGDVSIDAVPVTLNVRF